MDVLYDEYKWIADVSQNTPLVDVVRRIINNIDADSVYQSSIWAVGMAFLDYKENVHNLTDEEHIYARSRDGVLGMRFDDMRTFTLREYLEERDHGFILFSTDQIIDAA